MEKALRNYFVGGARPHYADLEEMQAMLTELLVTSAELHLDALALRQVSRELREDVRRRRSQAKAQSG
jgi:hypothetical protein